MAITETLLLSNVLATKVAPAVAKTVVRLWFNGNDTAQDIGTDLVDLFSPNVPDAFARKNGIRQLEEIGENIAADLATSFSNYNFTVEMRTDVAERVAGILDRTDLSAEILSQRDLDASELTSYFLQSYPSILDGYSEAYSEMFRRVLGEACKYIVSVASRLPSFNERNFAEILRRERELIDIANRVLAEIRLIREGSRQANSEERAAWFEEEYRLRLVQKLDSLELFGVRVTGANRHHRLTVAYVSLFMAYDKVDNQVGTDQANKSARLILQRRIKNCGRLARELS